MKHIVEIGDIKVSSTPGDVVVTYSLGSCVGVSMYDPQAHIGGILHFRLPVSSDCHTSDADNRLCFADTGIPDLLMMLTMRGAKKSRICVMIAGGAKVISSAGHFNIGKRNVDATRDVLQKLDLGIDADDTGGIDWRTMSLDISTGTVNIRTANGSYELTPEQNLLSRIQNILPWYPSTQAGK